MGSHDREVFPPSIKAPAASLSYDDFNYRSKIVDESHTVQPTLYAENTGYFLLFPRMNAEVLSFQDAAHAELISELYPAFEHLSIE